MNYELAKQLKDAGLSFEYPQSRENTYSYLDIDNDPCNASKLGAIYIPTLSELIEACGEVQDFTLYRRFNGKMYWTACWIGRSNSITELRAEGSTPEEAVANLWLELNK